MNAILQELLETKLVTAADGRQYPLHGYVPLPEGLIIQGWIANLQPRRVLEIGLGYAISTLFMLDALHQIGGAQSYQAIDPFQASGYADLGLHNLKRAGYEDRIILHRESSAVCLPALWAQGEQFDLIFIDGDHDFEPVFVDYFYASRLLKPGGAMLFDDVQLDDVRRVIEYVDGVEHLERLPVPEEVATNRVIQVRRLSGQQVSRVIGFRKR